MEKYDQNTDEWLYCKSIVMAKVIRHAIVYKKLSSKVIDSHSENRLLLEWIIGANMFVQSNIEGSFFKSIIL